MTATRHPSSPFTVTTGGPTLEVAIGEKAVGMDDRPAWARRITTERKARGWNKPQFIEALRLHAPSELPGKESLLRRVHAWESGSSCPDDFYKPIIAKTFGTVTAAIWPVVGNRNAEAELAAGIGMDTLEIVTRLRGSSIDAATLDGLRLTVDRLCSEYAYLPAEQLITEGRSWLRRITAMLDRQLTIRQHKELLSMAGWLAALVGCVEYDSVNRPGAEATRKAAWSLGEESGNNEVMAWAQEMRAWFALTRGDYRGVLAAAETGHAVAPSGPAAVQLHAQKAKAWARIGDRRQVEVALDGGRALLEQLPYPENLENHFAVDPAKWDFYSMDCYRILGGRDTASTENKLAESYAREVIRLGTDATGSELSPMRNAEARITLGVISARQGDLETAVDYGHRALASKRLSVPSLLMVSSELGSVLGERYSSDSGAIDYLDQLKHLRDSAT
jgi:tetratricopeptide (TPR) repeat protein